MKACACPCCAPPCRSSHTATQPPAHVMRHGSPRPLLVPPSVTHAAAASCCHLTPRPPPPHATPHPAVLPCRVAQGWPALLLMVYSREDNGRDSFVSYALVPLPNTPGSHKITAKTWFAVEGNNALGRRFFGACPARPGPRGWVTDGGEGCWRGGWAGRRLVACTRPACIWVWVWVDAKGLQCSPDVPHHGNTDCCVSRCPWRPTKQPISHPMHPPTMHRRPPPSSVHPGWFTAPPRPPCRVLPAPPPQSGSRASSLGWKTRRSSPTCASARTPGPLSTPSGRATCTCGCT